MSENKEETKQIKISVEDEAVEQLVENRYTDSAPTPRRRKPVNKKRKKKKKKHIALKILIVILAFILVFVVSFLASYTYFTTQNAKEATYKTESVNTPVAETDGKPQELAASQSAEYTPQPEEIFVEEKKSDDAKDSDKDNKKPASTTQKKPVNEDTEVTVPEKESASDIVDNEENSEGLDLGI